jgi:hypothetical protein
MVWSLPEGGQINGFAKPYDIYYAAQINGDQLFPVCSLQDVRMFSRCRGLAVDEQEAKKGSANRLAEPECLR